MAIQGNPYRTLWAQAAQQSVTALRALGLALCIAALAACSGADPGSADAAGTAGTAMSPDPAVPAAASAATAADPAAAAADAGDTAAGTLPPPDGADLPRRPVLVFGDSLSAAYNLAAEQGWVALLDARMRESDAGYFMVNASISGETTAGGASRIDAALAEHRPELLVLALGANDGLRGLPLEQTRANLERIVRAARAAGAEVLLVGMRLPPNYGADYTDGFFAMFGELARAEGATHLPFLLEPIALDDGAFQPDRLHPTAEAQPALAEHVWTALAPLLEAPASRGAAQSNGGQSAGSSAST